MNTPNKKVGRPRAYTPEALDAKFEEYVEWVKANPVYINKVSAGGNNCGSNTASPDISGILPICKDQQRHIPPIRR